MSLFNKPKRKINSRKKVNEDSDDEGTPCIRDIRELQRSRERRNGLTEIECAVGKEKAAALEDGIQMAGGTMALSGKQKARLEAAGIEAGIREQFEKETMLRDEHEELRKFIDQGLKKERGEVVNEMKDEKYNGKNTDVLLRAASKLKDYRSEGGNELLSEHMLAGIPEVDLGISYLNIFNPVQAIMSIKCSAAYSARINNILETEKKKKELLEKALTKGGSNIQSRKEANETEYFSQEQIGEIRECFNIFSQDGLVHSVPQLRCILRSLGYCPTATKTVEYFNSKSMDSTRIIAAKELRSILASIGEKMSEQEIDHVLQQIAVGGMVSHQKLIQFISN
uniref:Uncharacterized protein n=1 Tax=Heterorhabditis bacteriophora TaxID=37862 RepID=A0A1I7WRZ0_HETBA